MSVFVIIAVAIIALVVMLRFKVPLGPAILGSGLILWVFTNPAPHLIWDAAVQMVTQSRTWDLLAALYFVVCLEIELRKSGCLAGMVEYLKQLTPNKKISLAVMPAFLGLLPSIGGARFSAPIVEKVAQGETISENRLAAINFWFRHIFEFSSPIVPGMILACAIAQVPVGTVIMHLAWLTAAAFILGWLVLLAGVKLKPEARPEISKQELSKERHDFALSFSPIIFALILMLAFGLNAGVAMGITSVITLAVLYICKRPVPVTEVFIGAIEKRLFRDVFCIFLFIALLDVTGMMPQIVKAVTGAPLSTYWIIAILSFIVGVLTGLSQGHVAIVMPIVAAIAPGNLDLLSIALVCGVGGQMLTPTHMCLIITLNYFKADFFKTLWPCFICQTALFILFGLSVWLFPAA